MLLKIQSKQGVTMVETAGMLFFIFMFLGLIFTGGQMVSNKNTLNYATQVAAREASVKGSETEALNIAKKRASEILNSNGISTKNLKVSLNSSGWKRGNNFTIHVSTDYRTLFPIPGQGNSLTDKDYTMSSQVTMMVETR